MKEKKGIFSLVAAAAAWIIGFTTLIMLMMRDIDPAHVMAGDASLFVIGGVLVPMVLALAAIIMGIWSIVKKQGHFIMAVIGILLALPVVFWGASATFAFTIVKMNPAELVRAFLEGAQGL